MTLNEIIDQIEIQNKDDWSLSNNEIIAGPGVSPTSSWLKGNYNKQELIDFINGLTGNVSYEYLNGALLIEERLGDGELHRRKETESIDDLNKRWVIIQEDADTYFYYLAWTY